MCFKSSHFSHCVNVCCVGCVSVYPCKVTGLFRVDGSGSGDGDMEFFLPTVHKRGKQRFQSLYCFTFNFFLRDNNTDVIDPTMSRSFMYLISFIITATL